MSSNLTLSAKMKKGSVIRPFFYFGGVELVDEPTEFDKIAGRFWTLPLAATVRSEAEDERPSPVASNLTLSAICDVNFVRY